jgi:GTPase
MFRTGTVALAGAPNVGKSTLLNKLLGEELAIVTPKPQTTRDRLLGVRSLPGAQIAFVDTPGVHEGRTRLGSYMLREALAALEDVDLIVLVVEANTALRAVPREQERRILENIVRLQRKAVLALNKVDLVPDKAALLPLLQRWSAVHPFEQIVPIAARKNDGVDRLLRVIVDTLPEAAPLYSDDTLTDRPERYLVAEKVREQIYLSMSEEVPYATAVTVDKWHEREGRGDAVVEATIHVERDSQQGIIVGKGGAKIRDIGTRAREAASKLLGRPIHLKLWVRVAADWRDDDQALNVFGYKDQ